MEAAGIINECWRSIDGYANYHVSNIGRVRNTKTGAVLQGGITADGYQSVLLSKKGRMQKCLTHRLVAGEFVENPDDKQLVKHIDGQKEQLLQQPPLDFEQRTCHGNWQTQKQILGSLVERHEAKMVSQYH